MSDTNALEISVPCSKYAHLCSGYLTPNDEQIIRNRESNVFGVQLDQLKLIGDSFSAPGEDPASNYVLIAITVPKAFAHAIAPRLVGANFSPFFIQALQLCALSGIDLVRFSDTGVDIPGIKKARPDTDDEFYGTDELTDGPDEDVTEDSDDNS